MGCFLSFGIVPPLSCNILGENKAKENNIFCLIFREKNLWPFPRSSFAFIWVGMWRYCYHSHPYLSSVGTAYHYSIVGCDFYLLSPPFPNMNGIIWQLRNKGKLPGCPCLVSILKNYIMLYFTLWNSITFLPSVYEIWKVPRSLLKEGLVVLIVE